MRGTTTRDLNLINVSGRRPPPWYSHPVPFRPPVLSLLLFYTNVYFGGGIYYVKNDIFRGVIMMVIYHFQWLPSVAWTDQLRTFCCSCRWLWVFAIGQSARETEIHSSGAHYLWPLTIIINMNANGHTMRTTLVEQQRSPFTSSPTPNEAFVCDQHSWLYSWCCRGRICPSAIVHQTY